MGLGLELELGLELSQVEPVEIGIRVEPGRLQGVAVLKLGLDLELRLGFGLELRFGMKFWSVRVQLGLGVNLGFGLGVEVAFGIEI